MKSLLFSSMKSKGNFLSIAMIGLLLITLFGCQRNWKSGGDSNQKSGGESGVKVIIRTGAEAPGSPGTQFHMLTSLALNNSGQVALKATLVGGGVTNDNDEGIWVGDSESLVLAAREGTNAPGISGNHFGDTMFPTEAPLLNDDGQIAFKARFSPGGPIGPASQGIWVGTAESLSLVTRSGASVPGVESSSFRLFDDLRLNGVGQIAFKATLMGPYITGEIDEGIWSGSSGNLSMIKRKAPAIIVSTDRPAFDGLSINDDGRLMLRAQFPPMVTQVTEPSGASGVQVRYNYGIFMRPPINGSDLLVRPGDSARGAYVFEYLNEPAFNSDSNYAFAASYSAPHDNENSGIWFAREGNRFVVVIEKARPPGTPADVEFSDLAGVEVALNNKDEIAFRAGLRGTGVTDANNIGIWAGTRGGLSLVARTGSSAVGAPRSTFYFFPEHHLNNAGDVAFMAILAGSGVSSNSDTGIWATRQGNLSLVAREGDSYEVAPNLIRTVIELKTRFAFNDLGQVAFLARFSDDTIGLVVVTP